MYKSIVIAPFEVSNRTDMVLCVCVCGEVLGVRCEVCVSMYCMHHLGDIYFIVVYLWRILYSEFLVCVPRNIVAPSTICVARFLSRATGPGLSIGWDSRDTIGCFQVRILSSGSTRHSVLFCPS